MRFIGRVAERIGAVLKALGNELRNRVRGFESRPVPQSSEDTDWGNCQNCGRLLYDDLGPGYDDVVSEPFVTSSGDVYCIPCGRETEREMEDEEAEGFPEWDPYDEGIVYWDTDYSVFDDGEEPSEPYDYSRIWS